MKLRYDDEEDTSYGMHFHGCFYCECNEEIIKFFKYTSRRIMNDLTIHYSDHIRYDTIKDKIYDKIHVKKLKLLSSQISNVLDLNVLKVLFYPDEIKQLSIKYNREVKFGDIYFKNLKKLSIHVSNKETEIMPLTYILQYIVNYCPNIKELEFERSNENLQFIIENLKPLNKNLLINLKYDRVCNYKEKDQKYITENNLEKTDEETFLYKLPNTNKKQKIYVTIKTI